MFVDEPVDADVDRRVRARLEVDVAVTGLDGRLRIDVDVLDVDDREPLVESIDQFDRICPARRGPADVQFDADTLVGRLEQPVESSSVNSQW